MDPNATLRQIIELDQADDYRGVIDAALELLIWLGRDGFPPAGYTVDQAIAFAREKIRQSREALRREQTRPD